MKRNATSACTGRWKLEIFEADYLDNASADATFGRTISRIGQHEADKSAESKYLTSIRWDNLKKSHFPINNCFPCAFHPLFVLADVGFLNRRMELSK